MSIKETLSPLIRNSSTRRLSLDWTASFLLNNGSNNGTPKRKLSVPSTSFCSPVRPGRRHSVTLLSNPNSPSFGNNNFTHSLLSLGQKSPFTQQNHIHPTTPPKILSLSPGIESEFVVILPPSPEETPKSTEKVRKLESRRKSSTTRYDFNDSFLHSISLFKCPVSLHPEIILGRGSFGTVVAGDYQGQQVAVKVIDMKCSKKRESLKGEENALILLPSHPHIAMLLDIIHVVEQHRALVIIERIHNGNLLGMINDPDVVLDLKTIIRISFEIASALEFCHSYSLLHLDVKPQNVLMDLDGCSKLSDFGNSKRLSELGFLKNFTKLDGTVAYKAPELFRGLRPSDKSDVYSLAITMWQLQTREQPYLAETEHSVIYKVVAQNLRPKSVCTFSSKKKNLNPQGPLEKYKLLIELCWNPEPVKRPSMYFIHNSLGNILSTLSF